MATLAGGMQVLEQDVATDQMYAYPIKTCLVPKSGERRKKQDASSTQHATSSKQQGARSKKRE